ncbi:terpene synthase family protein [Streptomyces sp. NPDC097727]|uniref:terpene synthase family protein n=1 Tax=Streptomyces sp. NPDC097727 TaxID=3366092 RepID=UPI0037FA2511
MTHTRNPNTHTLPMPDLQSSFPGPFTTSPHADAAEEHTTRWLQTFPLTSSPRETKTLCNITAHGIAHALPTADQDSIFLCADLFLWLTAFDDTHGETEGSRDTARLTRRISHCIPHLADHHEPATDNDPYTAALHDLLHRFRERTTPTQYLRLTAHLRDNLFGILWEAQHLNKPDQVTLDNYYAMRPHTVFVRTIMTTAQIALNYELTDNQQASPTVRKLEKAVANLAGWINDLASYTKETQHGNPPPLSLPTLLIQHHKHNLEEAFHLASRMCEHQATTARLHITELTTNTNTTLTKHAHTIETITASYTWHIKHTRYNHY